MSTPDGRKKALRTFRVARRLPGVTAAIVRHGLQPRILLFGSLSPGDDLLCTTVLREARKRGRPFAMMTNHPSLFEHNGDPTGIIPVDDYLAKALRMLGSSVVQPYYTSADPLEPDRDVFAGGHILRRMCELADLTGEVALRPYLHLAPAEVATGLRAEGQIAIQSTGSGAAVPFANKEWAPSRFADVVRGLPTGLRAVQLGLANDPAIPGAIDLRGRTTMREAAAVISASKAFVGLEGFLGHLARAVNCPAVIVLGGRAAATTVGYPCNEYLAAPTPCAPCGLRNRCAYDRACLQRVTAVEVLAALERVLGRPRHHLLEDTSLIP